MRQQGCKQIDYNFADFPLQNPQRLKEPKEEFRFDHACISVEIPWIKEASLIMPSRQCRVAMLKFVGDGPSIHKSMIRARIKHDSVSQTAEFRRDASDAELKQLANKEFW